MVAKEFDESLRAIVQMNYGLVIISHAVDKSFTDQEGKEFYRIVPTLGNKPRNIVSRMCDLIGYSRTIMEENGTTATKLFLRGTPRYEAGSRFKYTPDVIDFSYKALVDAICEAIDKQAQEEGAELFTDERHNNFVEETLDFDELMSKFNSMTDKIMSNPDETKVKEFWIPRVTQITDKHLGRGVKVSQCSREQVEALSLIVDDLEELIAANPIE